MSQLSLRKGFAFVAALLLVGAAVAIAVATHGSGGKTGALRVAKINAVEGVGARSESSDSTGAGEDPAAAAQEDYQNRSYPASDTPFRLTRNAQKAWTKLQSNESAHERNLDARWPEHLELPGRPHVQRRSVHDLRPDHRSRRRPKLLGDEQCTVWAAAAGGGVWRTNNAYAATPSWDFISGDFATNAIGTLTYDALDEHPLRRNRRAECLRRLRGRHGHLQVHRRWQHLDAPRREHERSRGAGVDCDAVFGSRWNLRRQNAPAYSGPAFDGRSISAIRVSGNTMYVGSARGVRGISSVTGGSASLAPGLRPTASGSPRTAGRTSRCSTTRTCA